MDHFINYNPNSEMSMVGLSVWPQEGSHTCCYRAWSPNTELTNSMWGQKLRYWEPLPLYIIMAYVWGPQFCFFQLQFSKIAAGAFHLPLGHSWMNEEISFKETFIPEDFSCPCAFLLLKSDSDLLPWPLFLVSQFPVSLHVSLLFHCRGPQPTAWLSAAPEYLRPFDVC